MSIATRDPLKNGILAKLPPPEAMYRAVVLKPSELVAITGYRISEETIDDAAIQAYELHHGVPAPEKIVSLTMGQVDAALVRGAAREVSRRYRKLDVKPNLNMLRDNDVGDLTGLSENEVFRRLGLLHERILQANRKKFFTANRTPTSNAATAILYDSLCEQVAKAYESRIR